MPRLPLALLLLIVHAGVLAEVAVIPLLNRPAEQILPALYPHLEPGGGLSALDNQLIVSTTVENLARLRQIIATLDQPQRQLVITVRQESAQEIGDQGAGVSARIGGGQARVTRPCPPDQDGAGMVVRQCENALRGEVWSTRDLREGHASQRIRVMEGGSAFIHAGVSLPLALRQVVSGPGGATISESVVYHELGTGFLATPRLAGDRVTLEISPWRDTAAGDPRGVVETRRVYTTVSGRLGEWIPLGDFDQASRSAAGGYVTYSTRELRQQGRLLLKVEQVE